MLRTLSVDAGEDRWLPADCRSSTLTLAFPQSAGPLRLPGPPMGRQGLVSRVWPPPIIPQAPGLAKQTLKIQSDAVLKRRKRRKATLNVFEFKNSIILNKTWPLLSLLQTVFVVTLNHASLGLYVYTISNVVIISNYLKYYILNKI